MQVCLRKYPYAVFGFLDSLPQHQFGLLRCFMFPLGDRIEQINALSNIFQRVYDPQKCRNRIHLGRIQIDAAAGRANDQLSGGGVIK